MALLKTYPGSYRIYEPENDEDYALYEFTITCWIFGNHYSVDQHVVGMSSSNHIYLKTIDGFSYLAAKIGAIEVVDENKITDREWFHASIVWDGTIGRLYKSGVEVGLAVSEIAAYGQRIQERSVWAFNSIEGGNYVSLGVNYFTIWDTPLNASAIATLANKKTANVGNYLPTSIILGDYLDNISEDYIYGTKLPYRVITKGLTDNTIQSPFSSGFVPFPLPDVDQSESSSSSN